MISLNTQINIFPLHPYLRSFCYVLTMSPIWLTLLIGGIDPVGVGRNHLGPFLYILYIAMPSFIFISIPIFFILRADEKIKKERGIIIPVQMNILGRVILALILVPIMIYTAGGFIFTLFQLLRQTL